jgi:SAM-dependent methyltransferase
MANAVLAQPDYGIDAPGIVRNLFLGGMVGLVLWGTAVLGLWSGRPWGIPIMDVAAGCAVSFTAMGCFMLYSSKVGKLHERERLLDLVPWKGQETVLDVGCGRGLMLLGAARRLSTGKATGVDLWHAEDLTGNRPEATLENARREGVEDRVEVRTADMRELPFPDESFDVIVSHWAVHNLYAEQDRAKALSEMVRVLKPGGYIVLADIRHDSVYAAYFAKCGLSDVRRAGSQWKGTLLGIITFGGFRPATLVARKELPRPAGGSGEIQAGAEPPAAAESGTK